ncbi:MAG: alkene reductase [Novosphingobium sp. 28-62-57]|uniref:alkene reductase n=1 Tax=unclassified Novosphingobium TaxID=2644732 RepID=UPI000BD170BC|nr:MULTISPECIES: alkene reductase [unclassified Novosphingobium]OYW50213.1 MAG: alkene reductase [Novosphingobium sp. 12-62-10]OYZ11681.1 MAG: alkene reductase [Novosphingobium sp. 28-62-57]OZA36711.1 MAG: alkene reductase [Novosphingobium sp. 17-62-9]HQS69459.1 alkene reductase [Novosphingobium sp.]
MHEPLFQPIRLGAIEAPNRIIMAPLTRGRATGDSVPTPIMIEYYRQRASAGLIITEATGISREGLGWPSAPGIWSDEQTEAWKPIVEAVHAEGGRIVLQLWHMGRVVHSSFLGGEPPVSASATTAPGHAHTAEGTKPYEQARALGIDEMPRLIGDYRRAAENAKKAGFDGVQLHAANGYLIDQFLRDGTNLRDDDYGGSPQNRVRLMREVVEELIAVWGKDRVSIRLSPNGDSQGTDDSNPAATFGEAARVLQELGVSFVELRQPGPGGTFGATEVPKQDGVIRAIYTGPLVLNSDYTPEEAAADVASGRADAISFGRPFISNPDLVERIHKGAHLNPNIGVPQTWYFPGEHGYTDYPTLAQEGAAEETAAEESATA